jgi:cytochrome oxidase Cu insertion factor (SCO1/SenC/PrrC family)
MYNPSEPGTNLMRLAAEKSTNRGVRGSAMFWLAQSLKTSAEQNGDEAHLTEAKKLYETVAADYADVTTPRGFKLGEQAKSNLYEMGNLSVGKAAPEIEGKDADGKPIKLSDYAGKVVVIDFWGNW